MLVDPYARHVAGRRQWATRDEFERFETTVRAQHPVFGCAAANVGA